MRNLFALALLVGSLGFAGTVHADVVSDDSCHAWEHWEGGHSGHCAFGCRCATVGASGGDDAAPLVLTAFVLAVVARRRS